MKNHKYFYKKPWNLRLFCNKKQYYPLGEDTGLFYPFFSKKIYWTIITKLNFFKWYILKKCPYFLHKDLQNIVSFHSRFCCYPQEMFLSYDEKSWSLHGSQSSQLQRCASRIKNINYFIFSLLLHTSAIPDWKNSWGRAKK